MVWMEGLLEYSDGILQCTPVRVSVTIIVIKDGWMEGLLEYSDGILQCTTVRVSATIIVIRDPLP